MNLQPTLSFDEVEGTLEVTGTYGSGYTPTTVYGVRIAGVTWYAVEDSVNVNCTLDEIHCGVHVEDLSDINCFTSSEPIDSTEKLQRHAVEMHRYFDEAGW